MAKSYSSTREANNELWKLGINETVEICGIYYRVNISLLGKCFKRIKEQSFIETQIPDERKFKGSGNTKRSSKSIYG